MTKEIYKARNVLYKKSVEYPNGIIIKGYDFSEGFCLKKYINSLTSTGMESSHLGIAIEIIRKMRKDKAKIYLGFNSNIISSGLRDVITFLTKNRFVDVLVTTAGGIEEDIIKCLGNFYLGSFDANGKEMRRRYVNMTGNIFVPNNRYCEFEEWLKPILEEVYQNQKTSGKIISTHSLIEIFGRKIENESSYLYWAWKNKIPVFCPAIIDGAIGDQIAFFKYEHPDFAIDVSDDVFQMNESTLKAKKTGIIVLGSSFAKHFIMNANMFRGGADYAVIVTTESEVGGSDSGAKINEAFSWSKLRKKCKAIKVQCDATIAFPIIVAGAFLE